MKSFKFFLLSVLAVFSFTGCEILGDMFAGGTYEDVPEGYSITEAWLSEIWQYNAAYPIVEIGPEVKSIKVSNIPAGKTMYLVKRNTGKSEVKSRDTRYVTSASRAAVSEVPVEVELPSPESLNLPVRYHAPEVNIKGIRNSSARAAGSGEPVSAVIDYKVGATKSIYIDTGLVNGTPGNYAKRSAKLLYKGKSCYVWGIEGYYSDSSSRTNTQITTAKAKEFGDKFDELYPMITTVFGDEADQIISYDNGYRTGIKPIEEVSDTGSMINIVVYDIGNDYRLTADKQCNVLGYFYQKDYYKPSATTTDLVSTSNTGKYFYIDSAYANIRPAETISTLAHEFQHMVSFNQHYGLKDKEGKSTQTWYDEMLSMLCEDMMQQKLGITDQASPKGRMQGFNMFYYMSGITEYRNDSYSSFSYSTAYALGSLLARTYGGAELVAVMSQYDEVFENNVNKDSIVHAVNYASGKNYSFDDIFEQFLLSLTLNPSTSSKGIYTHNKNAEKTVAYPDYDYPVYEYPMTAFNIWSEEKDSITGTPVYAFRKSAVSGTTTYEQAYGSRAYEKEDYLGPFIFSNNIIVSLRGENGISIHGIKETSAATETIEFSASGADCLKMYLIIQ